VLFCLGLEVYTNYNTLVCNTELSSEQNREDNHVLSGADSFEDDHINQVHEPFFFVEQRVLIPNSNAPFLFIDFSFSSWQPPKFS